METNRQKRNIRIIFLVLSFTFLFSIYLIYSYFLETYYNTLENISSYSTQTYIFDMKNLFQSSEFMFTISFVIIVFLFLIMLAYLYIAYMLKHNNKKVLHIIDEINHDEFVPSQLEGEYGVLEQKIYNMKMSNDRYIEEAKR